jgi:tetratricopeptide (TPR) repeat protein
MARKKKSNSSSQAASQLADLQPSVATTDEMPGRQSFLNRLAPVEVATQSTRRQLLATLLLAALPWLAYIPLWQAGFIWDDDAYVTENIQIRTGQGLYSIWFVPRSIPQYYPLIHTMFWFEYQAWGLNPLGYHLVNVGLHALSSLLLWRILLRLKVPGAWFAASLFAVHPVMVESVAWVTERKNVLSLPLALASMICYWRYRPSLIEEQRRLWHDSEGSVWYYAASFLLFVAALLSKTVVCTLPAVLLVIEWWKHGHIQRQSVVRMVPFFAIGISLGLITVWLEKHHVGAQGAEWSLSIIERGLLAGRIVWFYAGKLVWPAELIFFYPRWAMDDRQIWQYLFPISALAVLVALWSVRNVIGRGPLAAVLIFVGVLFPALGFFDVYPFRYSYVADHFQYHASIALISLIATIVYQVVTRQRKLPQRQATVVLWMVASISIVFLSTLTFRQSRAYHGLESIYRDKLAKNPAARGATSNLTDHFLALKRYDEAIAVAEEGLAASPEIASTHNTMGAALLTTSLSGVIDLPTVEKSIGYFRATLQIEPNYQEALFNLATALSLLDRHDEAITHYRCLLEIIPSDIDAQAGLAKSLIVTGHMDQAIPILNSVLTNKPDDPTALHGMGLVKAQQGATDQAIEHFKAALKGDENLIGVRYDLAGALVAKGELIEARDQYLAVIKNQPWNARALNNLGIVYMNLDEKGQAIQHFSQAIAQDPSYQQAQDNLQRAQQLLSNSERKIQDK